MPRIDWAVVLGIVGLIVALTVFVARSREAVDIASLITSAVKTARNTVGSAVTYHSESGSVELTAALGWSPFEITDELGRVSTWRSRDFVLLAAELVIGGQTIEPQRGHYILLAAGSRVERYTVQHPDPKQPPWRYMDPTNTALRVHTARTAVS